jgi:hypothetical protein
MIDPVINHINILDQIVVDYCRSLRSQGQTVAAQLVEQQAHQSAEALRQAHAQPTPAQA